MADLVESGSKYTDEDRRRAVVEYAMHGVMSKVSRVTGIPQPTLSNWKQQGWWEGALVEVRSQTEEVILSNNLKIAVRSGEEILDRIDNGDTQIVQGKPVKVPVKARDLAIVGGISQDKYFGVQIQPPANAGTKDAIKGLVKMFEDLADRHNARTIEGEVVTDD